MESTPPKDIISQVREISQVEGNAIAQPFDNVTIIFAKITGIHDLFETKPTVTVVGTLDKLYKKIDALTDVFAVEKIKIVGDTYMAAVVSPLKMMTTPSSYDFAFALMNVVDVDGAEDNLKYKIGMHTGSVVAGVIGKRKFTYDLWGDAANRQQNVQLWNEGRIQTCRDNTGRPGTPGSRTNLT